MSSFRHRRDFRQSRTDVVVKGVGGEIVDDEVQLVWARYMTHADAYPCRYLPFGWGGEPYTDPDIVSIAQARQVATAIGDRVWGALGTLVWQTDGVAVGSTAITRFAVGDRIELTDPVEGQFAVRYVVRDVTLLAESVGHPVWELTVGDVQPDIIDIIRGVTVVQPIQQLLRGSGGGGATGTTLGPAGVPSAPVDIAPTRAPTHSQRNLIRAQFNDTIGLTLQATVRDRNLQEPVRPEYYAHPFQVTPPPTLLKPRPAPGLWASHDGEAHPYTVDFGYLAVDGTYGTHLDYAMAMRRLSVKGTGTVTLQKNGVTVAGPVSVSGSWINQVIGAPVLPPPAPPPGIPFLAGDDLHIVVSGTSGTGVSVKVKERADGEG